MAALHPQIAENHEQIRERIAAACGRSGRTPGTVKLVPVVKYAPLDWVRSLVELGVRDLGESRPQQLLERADLLPSDIRWHLVGHLQRNKARKVLPRTTLIHSVDTFRLLSTLDRLAGEMALRPRVLLQVNVAGERTKHGFAVSELREEWSAVLGCRNVDLHGLMAMAPYGETAEEARPVFRRLRELRDELADRSPFPLPELSMGMSNDFEVAVEEGATLVRIGSRLFSGLSAESD